jgi:SAM-dependent methyltransferase
MRQLVGPTDPAAFDNPSGRPVIDSVPLENYRAVFDFGCGCGRLARQLLQQTPRPERYVGVDLHAGMIGWCRNHLSPAAPGFEFHHHDVYNYWFNPGEGKPAMVPFPVEDHAFSLLLAWSVFTHVTEEQCIHYLREVARVLSSEGIVHSTWFLFDKADFPFMQSHALYVSYIDPSAAVVFDRAWIRELAADNGLVLSRIVPPAIKGYHWQIQMTPRRPGVVEAAWPEDAAPRGVALPPPTPANPDQVR